MRERGAGDLFNTAVALALRAPSCLYRKVFPGHLMAVQPSAKFVRSDIEGVGRARISICYDVEAPRSPASGMDGCAGGVQWGQDGDLRSGSKLVLAQPNAIMHQCVRRQHQLCRACRGRAGPHRSFRGLMRTSTPAADLGLLTDVLDLDPVGRPRAFGTAGGTRVWGSIPGGRTRRWRCRCTAGGSEPRRTIDVLGRAVARGAMARTACRSYDSIGGPLAKPLLRS